MEQVNSNPVLAMLQAIASQNQIPKTGKSGLDSDFQKMMDKAASSTSRDTKADGAEKTDAAGKNEEAPVEQEDALTRVKKMLEQNGNVVAFKPDWPWIKIDLGTGETIATYNPGEYIALFNGETFENIPITGLEPWQHAQLNQLLIDPQPIDVSDPRVDAMLEATAPGADNSPAALLEKLTGEQFGKEIKQIVEEVQPQEQEGDTEMEIVEVDQAPQKLFHDVEAAPVKVGDVYNAEQVDEPNVVQQIDAGLAQALQKGESMVRIQLNPENLGSVTIEISQSAEGIIRVALSAHSSETRGLLERHAGELQGLLAERSQQSVEVDVQRQAESQQNQNQQNYDGHNGHAQDGQERRRHQQEPASSQDFIQQLRLGLIPSDGDDA